MSTRSSLQAKFPAQVYDVKAAVRWLRVHAREYRIDPFRVAVMGDSSGGWTATMAGVTGDVAELEGNVGVVGCPIQSCPSAARAANPITYLSRNDPPFLTVTSTRDCHDRPGLSNKPTLTTIESFLNHALRPR